MSYEVVAVEGDLVSFTETTDGGRWRRQVDPGVLRFLGRPELDRFLAGAGLVVVECYGDWQRGPLTDTSPEIVVVARRADGPVSRRG